MVRISLLLFSVLFSFKDLQSQAQTFNYTGQVQIYVVPSCVFFIIADVKGAAGANTTGQVANSGGKGGRVRGTIEVTPGETLYVYVGGTSADFSGGWNGGGAGAPGGGGGGGASDIRRGGQGLSNRIIVAGGGGGAGLCASCSNNVTGGDGGGLTGTHGFYITQGSVATGKGATQTSPGPGGVEQHPGSPGTSGLGGAGGGMYGGGGGGGYYGGGGGATNVCCWSGGGGGGSGYIIPSATGTIMTTGFQSGNGIADIIPITSTGPATPAMINGPLIICEGEEHTYSIDPVPSASSYTWTAPPGATILSGQGTAGVTIRYGAIPGNLGVKAENSCGSSSNCWMPIAVNPNPIVTISPGNTSICIGDSITLTATGATDYVWSPSTGLSVDNGSTVQASPDATVTYTVTGTGTGGCTHSASATVNVILTPAKPSITSNSPVCAGELLLLETPDIPGATFHWQGPGGLTSNVRNPSIPVKENNAGNYTLTADISGCTSPVASAVVVVYSSPQVELGSDTAFCQGGSYTLLVPEGYAAYRWSTGAEGYRQMINETGHYWVEVKHSNGCKVSDSVEVTVWAPPVIPLGPDTSICRLDTLLLSAGEGHTKYRWSDNSSASLLAVTKAGLYFAEVTDTNGCSNIDSIQVRLLELPVVSLGPDLMKCRDDELLLSAGEGFDSYQWNTGDTLPTLYFSPYQLEQGTHHFSVTVADSNRCTARDEIQVTISTCDGLTVPETEIIKVYPNPSSGKLFIQNPTREYLECGLLSISGNKIHSLAGWDAIMEVDLSGISPGTYLLEVAGDRLLLRYKLEIIK